MNNFKNRKNALQHEQKASIWDQLIYWKVIHKLIIAESTEKKMH